MRRAFALLLASVALTFAQGPPLLPIPSAADGTLRSLSIGKTEVTVQQFESFVSATGYRTKAEIDKAPRTWRSPGYEVAPALPVTYVTAMDAAAYCAWTGARLPTDAEWEHAARAGATTRHSWGDAINGEYLWYRINSNDSPRAVGTRKPNAFGLYDMEGNVWEWTLPRGPVTESTQASRRGGSWVDCEDIEASPGGKPHALIGLAVSFKVPVVLNHRYDDIGFRCAKQEQ
ncbi:MAG: SUMF1/EgtB/PvdO family nonheme iron enzyme [Bryobacterales bacterium]|nr:SUMF1/EgtB/PvdO family nonheme iron enzyme [Bryobacterales bacterium]